MLNLTNYFQNFNDLDSGLPAPSLEGIDTIEPALGAPAKWIARSLKERAEILRSELEKSLIGLDKYLEEWRRHSLESAEREIVWLEDMIKTERK